MSSSLRMEHVRTACTPLGNESDPPGTAAPPCHFPNCIANDCFTDWLGDKVD
eukprot:m.307650 g.307650  ORF g.307650 m.307650 type:complete len:52 (+) comp42581_c0_seq1:294-449(+)